MVGTEWSHRMARTFGKARWAETMTAHSILGRKSDLDVDPSPPVSSPAALNELDSNTWAEFATDPRDVDVRWVNEVLRGIPIKVKRVELSHNAAEAQSELIRVGLVWGLGRKGAVKWR